MAKLTKTSLPHVYCRHIKARSNVIDALDALLTPDEELVGRPPVEGSESLTLTVAS
jgi:hypothetical protein